MRGLTVDPRARVVLLLLSFVPPLCFNSPGAGAAVAAAYVAVGLGAGAGATLRRAAPVLLPLVLTSALLWALLLGRGEVVIRLGPLALRDLSLLFGLAMGFRFVAWSVAGLVFLALTPVEQLAWALRGLGLPYPLAFGLSLSVRMARQLSETAVTVAEAQQVRGLDLSTGSLLERLRKASPMLVPLLVLSLRRVNQMAMAMEARGYGSGPRTSWLVSHWSTRDTMAVLLAMGLAAGAAWLRLRGVGVLLPDRL